MSAIDKKLYILAVAFLLTGCAFKNQGIENPQLRDRVLACGAGFSDSTLGSLQAAYEAYPFEGEAKAGFKESAKEIIFIELPPQDRFKAYEDYLKCIESQSFPRKLKK